jgi:hypothetical protein
VNKLNKFIKKIKNTDKLLDKQTPMFLLSVLVLILRIPNLFEPYWYGDEGIYLTIGQSLNKGAKLYSEIIDHKTPIIYYLARVQTQLNFRLLNIGWMLLTTIAFYYFAKKLLKSVKQTTFATFIFVILTTLPWLEGNIPNGELFVLGFVIWGGMILSNTNYFKQFFSPNKKPKPTTKTLKNNLCLIASGIFFGLGILTKVPAILDLGVFLVIGYFTFTNDLFARSFSANLKVLGKKIVELSLIIFGVMIPAVASIVYFVLIGSGQEYLDFGLLYNFRYAASWALPFSNELLLFLFTLQGKVLLLAALIIFLTILKKYFKPSTQFIMSWFGLALFASLLSNRPYPHYFIQLVPPLALMLTLIIKNKYLIFLKSKINPERIINLVSQSALIVIFIAAMLLLNFSPYPTKKYYVNWYKLVTNQITKEEYRQSFDYLMNDNYKAAEIIKSSGSKDLFIWGTNPMLYALTETQPTGRFTVSFHIKDFDAFGETARDVVKKEPMFIVIMNNEDHPFSEFRSFLDLNYLPNSTQFDHFTLWKKNNDIDS